MQLHLQRLGAGEPLVILHGLFGSFDNWGRVSKQLASHENVNVEVISIDLRNHGDSPHASDMNYAVMAEDVTETLARHGIEHYHLLGHSMGGKVAMTLAQQHGNSSANPLRSLIIVDIAARHNPPGHLDIIAALQDLDLASLKSRNDANEKLSNQIPDLATRQFLLKNLQRESEGGYSWRLNLDDIAASYDHLLLNPLEQTSTPLKLPTLVIRGSISDYVSDTDIERFRHHFPILTVHTIEGAGHWPHASHTQDTTNAITTFLNSQPLLTPGI